MFKVFKKEIELNGKKLSLETGKIGSIYREKNQAKQVSTGQECGITLRDFNDYKKKDIIEAFKSTITERMI